MTGSRPSTSVGVRGGAGGIEARYDDMVSAARLFGGAAIDVGGAAFALHGYLLDPGLVSGGLLDPVGGFHFEEHLAEALDGRGGLTWIAARCAAVDAGLRAAAAAYETGDRLMTRVHSLNDGLAGVPDAALRGAATAIATGSVRAGVERFAASDPELVDDLVIAAGGVHGRVLLTATALLQDGRPVVDALGRDPAPTARVPPRDVRDLIGALALRNQASHGEIDVRILARLDGTRAAIVDIPGTKSWQLLPSADVTSTVTNVRAVAGRSTAYERGVLAALGRAGVRPGDDVMLVGHSEGGMVAVRAAIDATSSGRFHVTHVVTAAAPIGALVPKVPAGVRVLAIENQSDLVPHADGITNADRVNVVTATIHHDTGSIGGNHVLDGPYLAGAADIDASGDASIREFVSSASRYFDATTVVTDRFVITRAR